MKRWFLPVWVLLISQAAAFAESSGGPRFVVNLLDYVAADYGGAVSNGKVTSKSEYQEQIEFTENAIKALRELEIPKGQEMRFKMLEARTQALLKLIRAKAHAGEVAEQAQSVKRDLIEFTGLPVAPASWPNLATGAKLFAQNCVACHGAQGRGDGPAGVALDPRPANFFDPGMAERSAFREFNVIRVGVPGTGMAPFNTLSDAQAWSLAFYVLSLRHGKTPSGAAPAPAGIPLAEAATLTELELSRDSRLGKTDEERKKNLALLRLASGGEGPGSGPLNLARAKLDSALSEARAGRKDEARRNALAAYLEGVEPVEARLRANAPAFVPELEEKMASVRASIEKGAAPIEVEGRVKVAQAALDQAIQLLTDQPQSAWLVFLIAAGVLLREGFEAVLILIALLAVIRASGPGARKAAVWVHGGWVSALGLGFAAWFFSGWLMGMSGADRELLEGLTSMLAIAVLLYMGFWLHSRTELNRWNHFIHTQVKAALAGGNLLGIAAISFMAVFREAFETVLFLRAVWLEGGDQTKVAMAAGVFSSLGVIFFFAWSLLRFSAKLPVRTLFSISSGLMAVLSVILMGKGLHSLQETGALSVTLFPLGVRSTWLGVFPTYETWVGQIAILMICLGLWLYGKRPSQPVSAQTQMART